MNDPLLLLLAVGAALAVAVALFWPGWGLAGRLRRGLAASGRVEIEDALKHLWDCAYRQQPCTLQSLAGTLGLSGRRATELVTRLERLDLVLHAGAGLRLSPAGDREALRVVRSHRLWERYFADQTGLAAPAWHAEAERREHATSAAELAALEASLGYPRFDPHGDPIPLPTGEVPPPRGKVLTALAVGETAEVLHVEDEPEAVFAQLSAAGLLPGTRLRVLEVSPQRIRLAVETEEVVLAPIVAANLTVLPLAEPEAATSAVPLSALALGERAAVVAIAAACRGAQRRRLLDLGVVPGTAIASELVPPGGDPIAYRIRGALIALRREQADLVQVERLAGGAA